MPYGQRDAFGAKMTIEDDQTSKASMPAGFLASGVHAGFRRNPERDDLALVVAEVPCACAATFTQNLFAAPPVLFDKRQLNGAQDGRSFGCAQALIVNSGNANAATGEDGMRAAEAEATILSEALGIDERYVLVASTGVIGVQLPMEPFESGVPIAKENLSKDGLPKAARAIMTTDTRPKIAESVFSANVAGSDVEFRICGIAKGSGMIMPNMATMIAILLTDAPVKPEPLQAALSACVAKTFNKVTVDSDTSTNDSCFLFASGKAVDGRSKEAAQGEFAEGNLAYESFCAALMDVCDSLARQIAADGEGSTKLVEVHVSGAASEEDADKAARTVANSPLVKTAIAGRDANWGRIAAALGRSGAAFEQECVDIDMMGIPVCRKGLALPFSEDEASKAFESDRILIDANLNAGDAECTIWTCDLTHEYISINGDYRT